MCRGWASDNPPARLLKGTLCISIIPSPVSVGVCQVVPGSRVLARAACSPPRSCAWSLFCLNCTKCLLHSTELFFFVFFFNLKVSGRPSAPPPAPAPLLRPRGSRGRPRRLAACAARLHFVYWFRPGGAGCGSRCGPGAPGAALRARGCAAGEPAGAAPLLHLISIISYF